MLLQMLCALIGFACWTKYSRKYAAALANNNPAVSTGLDELVLAKLAIAAVASNARHLMYRVDLIILYTKRSLIERELGSVEKEKFGRSTGRSQRGEF